MSVCAFQPRKSDPPQFVCENANELYARLGEYVGGGQCDGCGNHSYRLSARYGWHWLAICEADPDEDPEFRHPAPCGAEYKITSYDESLVTF